MTRLSQIALIVSIFFVSVTIHAQNNTVVAKPAITERVIKGVVVDEHGSPLEYATIFISLPCLPHR